MHEYEQFEIFGNVCIIHCPYTATYECYDQLVQLFNQAITLPNLKKIFLILPSKDEADPTGLSAVIHFHALLVGGRKRLYLCMPPPKVRKILKNLELGQFLRILKNKKEITLRLPENTIGEEV